MKSEYIREIEQRGFIYQSAEIDELERSEIDVKEFTQYKELYGWFLIPAFILGLGMETTRRSIFRSKT